MSKSLEDVDVEEKKDSREATNANEGNEKKSKKEKKGSLERNLGLFSSVGVIVGCIVGSGIFISPAGVIQETGSVVLSLSIWLVAGIFVALGSFVYIELGLLLTLSGGDYSYITEAFGGFAGFMRLWSEAIVVRPCSCTIVALTFSQYVLAAAVGGKSTDNPILYLLIAAATLMLQTFFNAISVKVSAWVNNICMIGKIAALFGVIGTGIYAFIKDFDEASSVFKNPLEGTMLNPGKIAYAFYSSLFAYQGWNYLNFIIEEVQNPEKVLPKAVVISISIVIVCYLFVNVAFFTALSPIQLINSNGVAIDFLEKVTEWKPSGIIISLFVALSCFGSGNGTLMTSSRLVFVGARYGHLPKFLVMTNPQLKTPIPSVIFTGLLSLLYLCLSNNVITLINYISISYWAAIALATMCLFYFRIKKRKDEKYKTKYPIFIAIIFFLGCLFLVIFPFIQDWKQALIGIGIVATGAPFYLFVVWRPKCLAIGSYKTSLFIQKLFLVYDGETKNKNDNDNDDTNKNVQNDEDVNAIDEKNKTPVTETPSVEPSAGPSVEKSIDKSAKED